MQNLIRTEADKGVVQRVIEWNAARYEQEWDYELAIKLLLEETQELYDAPTPVEALDAIGDILFVAIGALWKLGMTQEQIEAIVISTNLHKLKLEEAHYENMCVQASLFDIPCCVDQEKTGAWPALTLIMFSVFITCIGAARSLGVQPYIYEILHIICDSNDTKIVKGKVAANVKANIDKGDSYVAPTAALRKLYNFSLNQTNKELH